MDAAGIAGIITALAGLITAITALIRGNQHRAQVNPGTVQAQIDNSITEHNVESPHIYADGSTH